MPLTQGRNSKIAVWLGIIILAAGGSIWLWFFSRWGCETDVRTTTIANSQWVVLTKIDRCSAIDGIVTILALNKKTNAKVEIAFLDEESVPVVRALSPKEVQLTFENLVDIVRSKKSFGDITVLYKFVPRDDPVARHEYEFWAHHHDNQRAVRWCQMHFRNGC